MKRALLVLWLGTLASAEERAFVEMETPRTTYFVHEPFRLRLRVGFDRRFLETNVVQMFSRELDVPVQVHAPWLDELCASGRVVWQRPWLTSASHKGRQGPVAGTPVALFPRSDLKAPLPPVSYRRRDAVCQMKTTFRSSRLMSR